jgi:arsenite-transporting ATPase
MTLAELENTEKCLIAIGGKGGVGKTTCASAVALHLASLGRNTLLISSDPTPSLSDIFEQEIGARETSLAGLKNLVGLEINSKIVLERWKKKFGPEIYEVLSSLFPVDYDIIDYLGTVPGIEEEYMLDFIMELVESKRYDLVVWDTAPAGHTLQLLEVPSLFITHLTAALKVYLGLTECFKKIKDNLGLGESRRSVLDIIKGWKVLAEKIIGFLKDPQKTEFVLVTIPEALGVKQSERILRTFDKYGLSINYMVVNYVIETADSNFLVSRQRMQKEYLDYLEKRFKHRMSLIKVSLAPYEIKGVERLREISQKLFQTNN